MEEEQRASSSGDTSSVPSSDNTEKRAKIEEQVEARIRRWKQSEGYKQLHHNTQKIVEDSMRR